MSEPEIPAEWVEAAAKALADALDGDTEDWLPYAPAALSAALPLIERALKAEALREAADAASVNFVFGAVQLKFADWLRDRAEGLEEA